MSAELLLSQFINGIGNGLIYFTVAVGFTLVFGLMNFVNFAHGAFVVLGAYLAFEIIGREVSFWVALVVSPLVVGLLAVIIERLLLRRLYRMAHTYQIVATIGLAIGIQEIATLVWGPNQFTLRTPDLLMATVNVGPITYPLYRIFVVALTTLLALALWLLLERTRFGAMLRAGSEDADMVSCLGINVYRLFSLTFAGAAVLAALAGVLSGPMRGLNPTSGDAFLGLAVVVIVVGGVGSYVGALVAALVVAEVQSLAIVFAPAFGEVVVYALMAGVLLAKSDVIVGRFSRA